jgi:3-oxoacyl-[acyl-carrier-protein] synthase-3
MHNANLSIRVAVRYFVEAIREAAAASGVSVDDVDWFIPHQANARLLEATARAAGVPFEKFYLTLQKYGNISSASCAIALDEAARDGTLRPGDLVCVPVFGGGLTWGSAMVRW